MNTSGANRVELVSESPAETLQVGRLIGERLSEGAVFALYGDLGSGKTVLSKGMASGLGVDEEVVVSPTFVLVMRYEGRVPMYHIDAFRLSGGEDLFELGCDEMFYSGALVVIEWAERVRDALPADHVSVRVEHRGRNRRSFIFEAVGEGASATLDVIRGVVEGLPADVPGS